MNINYKILKAGRVGIIQPMPQGSLAKTLEKQCSYEKQGKEFMPNPRFAMVKLYKINRGTFPWGLLKIITDVLEAWQKKSGDTYSVMWAFSHTEPNLEHLILRPYQKNAIMELIKNHGGILAMPTGSGKTLTCIKYLEQMNKPALVIVHTRYLKRQWEGLVNKNVHVKTYQSLKNLIHILPNYEIIVFDEVHHVAARTLYTIAMKLKDHIVIGLSATPYREDGEDLKIKAAIGEIVYQIELREIIKQGYLVDAEVKWINLEQMNFGREEQYAGIYSAYIVDNVGRNNAILRVPLELYKKNKILILISQIDHGQKLFDVLNARGEDVVFLHSKAKLESYDHRIIIATSILDEGIDLPDREVIVMGAGGKSSIKVTQRIGRVLRLYPGKAKATIIDFIDRSKFLHNHYILRKEKYDEYGFAQELLV